MRIDESRVSTSMVGGTAAGAIFGSATAASWVSQSRFAGLYAPTPTIVRALAKPALAGAAIGAAGAAALAVARPDQTAVASQAAAGTLALSLAAGGVIGHKLHGSLGARTGLPMWRFGSGGASMFIMYAAPTVFPLMWAAHHATSNQESNPALIGAVGAVGVAVGAAIGLKVHSTLRERAGLLAGRLAS